MSFLLMMAAFAALAYLPQALFGQTQQVRRDWRMALRHGAGAAFVFTGVDHFVALDTRYLPMIPPYLATNGALLVQVSGALELLGGVALLLPLRAWQALRLPDLRPLAGLGLAMLLSVMVIANGHVAATGSTVERLPFGTGYYVWRPFLQPLILAWVLLASGALRWPLVPAGQAV